MAFKRSDTLDHKKAGKDEGVLISDVGYIKSSIDRMEKKLDKVEEKNHELMSRIIKVEEKCEINEKRMDEHVSDKRIHGKGV